MLNIFVKIASVPMLFTDDPAAVIDWCHDRDERVSGVLL